MDEEDESQEVTTPPYLGQHTNAPLCVFYYTHPCRVEDPEDEFISSYGDFRRPVTQPMEPEHRQMNIRPMGRNSKQLFALFSETESWRRLKADDAERRREKRTPNRALGRRYLREPPRHLNTYLLTGRQGSQVIDLDVVIDTVREAWVPHRSYSLDRALDQPAHEMGTGGRSSLQNTRGRPLLAGLPHRRYSVPETIMRKYTLTKQKSESNSDGSAKTVPTMTPPTMSTSPKKLSNASDWDRPASGGGKTPPGDRRRKTGRRMFDDGFKKPTRGTFRVRKGPPMYRGNHGNLDPISDSAESDFITQEDVKMSLGEKTSGTSSSEEIKSPDCAECKAFLRDVVAEEVETNIKKSPPRLPTSDVNDNVIQESAIEVPLDDNTQKIEDKPVDPDIKPSEGSNPLDEKSDRTSPKFVIPRIKPVLSKTPAFKSVSEGNSEEAGNAIQTPPNSERSKSSSIEQVSDLSTPSPYEYQSSADSGAANHNYSTLTPDTETSTSEKTSGYSELSSLENNSPGNAETSPDQEPIPRLELGPASSSVTPVSSSTPNEGSGQGSGSSPSPREPRSDRSSTQDSTLSVLSESTPPSKAFSMLSSVSTPIFTSPVLAIATESKQTQYDPEDAQFESIATNTDSPVAMETTSTNTEQFQDFDTNSGQLDFAEIHDEKDKDKLTDDLNVLDNSAALEKSEILEEVFTEKFAGGDLEGVVNEVNPMTHMEVDPNQNVADNIQETVDDVGSDRERDSISPSNRSDSLNSLDGDKAPRVNDDSPKAANEYADTTSSQPSPINRHFSMSRSTEEKYAKETRPPPSQSSDLSSRELMFSPESQSTLDRDVYSFANRFDEDEYIKLTHQRQRFWMSRKPSEITLPATPSHGALSCVGAGTIYRRNNFDVQLVVPRYSALPRSISMLVNTSSADCSSNSSDSECLSLVDSLDEAVSKSPSRFRTEDVMRLLPDESVVAQEKVNVATPRGKAKAFFVPMDEPISMTDQVPVVAAAMPDKLKEKLYRRQKVIDLKRQQKAESQEIKEKELKAKLAKERKSSKAKVGKGDKKSPRDKAKKVKTPRKEGKGDGSGESPRSTTKDDASTTSKENFPKPKKKASENQESVADKPKVDAQDISKPMLPTKQLQKSSIPIKKGTDPPRTSPRGGTSPKPSQLPIRRRHVSPPIRRSANLLGRFQQRFEVIPEEKSGSMESSEETGRHSKNKLPAKEKEQDSGKDVSPTSTLTRVKRDTEPKSHKRIPRPTRTLRPNKASHGPVIENIVIREIEDDSKDSYQGKAALAPHTDEGMSALSKGWINFYMLRGMSSPENQSDEALLTLSDKERHRRRSQNSAPLKTVNVVGGNGNRIRTYTVPYHEPRTLPSIPALPEIKSDASSRKQSLKSAEKPAVTSPDSNKITAVLHLPSPRLPPPYLFDGSEEQMTSETSSVTSSDSESERVASPVLLPVRWPIRQQQRRLPPHRSKSQHGREHAQYPRQSSANVGVGWTVTVASTNSQHTPDLEMRLSFPNSTKRQPNSQSDSGLGEDNNNNNKGNGKETRDERSRKQSHFLPPTAPVQQTQRWTLTVKNGGLERMQDSRAEKRLLQSLPELENQQGPGQLNTKKAIKRDNFPLNMNGETYTREMRQLSAIWPNSETLVESKVIIRKTTARYSRDVRSISQLFNDAEEEMVRRAGLAVTGLAIMPERKPRVPTMSERDLTRGLTPKRY